MTTKSTRAPITHELKCWPEPFQAVKDGSKPLEWRKDDRDYRVGDTLLLREYTGEDDKWYTGDELRRTVTYIIREGFGIPEGYCIMGLSQPRAVDVEAVMEIVNSEFIGTRERILHEIQSPQDALVDTSRFIRARLTGLLAALSPRPEQQVIEAGDAMAGLLINDRSGNAHSFVMRCANNPNDTFNDVAADVSKLCVKAVVDWDAAKANTQGR